jgi:bacteriocin biosynthesis cyclodehydratase domain-containing protein
MPERDTNCRIGERWTLLDAGTQGVLLSDGDRTVAFTEETLVSVLRAAALTQPAPEGEDDTAQDACLAWLRAEGYLEPARATAADAEASALRVYLTSDYLHPEADVGDGPALLARASARTLRIGPYIAPGAGACQDCLRHWLSLHRWQQAALLGPGVYWPAPAPPPGEEARQAAAALLRIAGERYRRTGSLDDLAGGMWELDMDSLQTRRIPVLSRSDCPRCGSTPRTLEQVMAALANPVTGIVEKLQMAPDAYPGLALALGSVLCPLPEAPDLPPLPPFSASGNGATPAQARERLVMEAVERHCAVYTGRERLSAVYFDGSAARPVRPDGVLLGVAHAAADTTGCGAAFSYPQAIRHGLLEVVERSAVARWQSGKARPPALSMPSAWRLPAMDLVDLTSVHGIPVAAAITRDPVYCGAAADTCLHRAAWRAACEAAQFAFWGPRQGGTPEAPVAMDRRDERALGEETARRTDEEEVLALLECLGEDAAGAYWVDLTRGAIGIPVVRVVLPRLQPNLLYLKPSCFRNNSYSASPRRKSR